MTPASPPEIPDDPDDEILDGPDAEARIGGVVIAEFGERAAESFFRSSRAQERLAQQERPHEGLRERKKRLTRQRLSNAATAMFIARGFDAVTVAEIADRVGVSEKTVYNYFPTKESLVFDQNEEDLADIVAALRTRGPGVTPTAAMLGVLRREAERFELVTEDESLDFLTRFGEMIRGTPALRAAWAEFRGQLVEAVTVVLAEEAGVDPREPEPIVTARALISLQELFFESFSRNVAERRTTAELRAAIEDDLQRAARLLDTGLWSINLMVQGRRTKEQLREAAITAEQARKQVLAAMREAKRAWRGIRDEVEARGREQRREFQREAHRGRRGR